MGIELNHLHMLGKAHLRRPPTTVEQADEWLKTLVSKINMKILIGPFSVDCKTLGNEGITGAVVIETSHLSGHFWHAVDEPFGMFDIYSCVEFDPEVVIQHLDDHFGIISCNYTFIDRNHGAKILEHKTILKAVSQ